MNPQSTWVPSRFNMWTRCLDGTLLVYNSLSCAFMQFKGGEADYVATILADHSVVEPKGILSVLAMQGLLVPGTSNEMERARRLHQSLFEQDDRLSLTLIPTENCNFRCVYCYEEFKRTRMSCEVIDSIVRLVHQQAAKLHFLSIDWFGGEPLTALDIVEEISQRVLAICKESQIQYSASMSTNGYLLTDQRAERCFSARISSFMVTLDGPAETHDKLRILSDGRGTFDTIIANLRNLRDNAKDFHVRIRVNFTPDTIPHIPKFLKFLGSEFGGDARFSIYFRPVGHWGGKQDHLVKTCDPGTAVTHEIHFMSLALQEGFRLDAWKESLQPFGSVCYAANPRSFVIGVDGIIYKCTLAINDPRNQIGRVSLDGTMNIREDTHRLWTSSGEETDTECQQCAFRPACQGNRCPLERLNRGEKTCPIVKTHLDEYLPLLATEAEISLEDGKGSNVR